MLDYEKNREQNNSNKLKKLPEVYDREAVEDAWKRITKGVRINMAKSRYGWLPTGERLQRFDSGESDRCNACEAICETLIHIISCTHKSYYNKKMNIMNDVKKVSPTPTYLQT